ncbi:Phospho-2-dehydro-3-deoxyheptonate aldolase AMT16 [Paramyrothecium foliicola]|nr:Phospho-2-dehydro-3-deoxyheptonate aldolase AMT16 [Paramyrothecium foliicola]
MSVILTSSISQKPDAEQKIHRNENNEETWSGADESRIHSYSRLLPPVLLQENIPLSPKARQFVLRSRQETAEIIRGTDSRGRMLVVVGPCSIHDPKAALDYCNLLIQAREKHEEELLIVMRCYLEKPRTTTGWKGLINDPDMDGSFKMNKGLSLARGLLSELTSKGMPVASEILDNMSPEFFADLLSAGFIGARTTESQIHRELASGLGFPIGFKNGTDGSLSVAVNAITASRQPHHFLSIDKNGNAVIATSVGNEDCFVVLRGGSRGTNYDAKSINEALSTLIRTNVTPRLMVDCSHGNSGYNHKNQLRVVADLARQVGSGCTALVGVMLESNINEGKQQVHPEGKHSLQYGVSVTDACINWADTENALSQLADAVKQRRAILGASAAILSETQTMAV